MAELISVNELSTLSSRGLVPCECCGNSTFDGKALDKKYPNGNKELPEGFTAGNRRRYVTVRNIMMTLCTKCRYDVYGAY